MSPLIHQRLLLVSLALTLLPLARSESTTILADPGFSIKHMDLSVPPGTDFKKFAAGNWYARTQIPADKSRWGGFNELTERNWADLHAILQMAAANPGVKATVQQQVGDFFGSALDVETRNARGLSPIAETLKAIDAVQDRPELIRLAGQMHLGVGEPFFNTGYGADQKRSDVHGFYLTQGGMGLPSKEYYFSEKFARERWEYLGHVAKMFELAGEPKPMGHQRAEIIFAIEKALAEHAKLPVDLRDRVANYNKMSVADAVHAYPGLQLKVLMSALEVPDTTTEVIIGQPKFFEALSTVLMDRSVADLKAYLRWQILRDAAPYLTEALEQESFRFYGTILNGTPQQEPRWQRAGRVVDSHLGEALGQLYVAKHYPPAAKARMQEMIDNLKVVMRERLQKVEWMTDATRARALTKFDRFVPMIGHTEKWRDYSKVEIRRDDYYGNVQRAALANSRYEVNRVGRKVDKTEWRMTPPTVNAYFAPTENQIVFPAGILQPPFFDPKLDDAVNYGAIGGVIGHEITHGFDDQGRRFDSDGNLHDWWTAEDAANFRERAQRVVDQYNQYEALPGLSVNGQLSLGENIADLGGTSIAFEAYQRSLQGKPRPPKIDGFTGEQRFFISWAQMWRTVYRDDSMRLQVARGPHAPGNFRAIGPLVNQQEFYDAFGIKETDPMWRKPELRAKLW